MVNSRVESALEVLGRYRCHDSNTLPIHVTHAMDQILQPAGEEEEKKKKGSHQDDDDQGVRGRWFDVRHRRLTVGSVVRVPLM